MFKGKGSLFRRIFFPLAIVLLVGLVVLGTAFMFFVIESRVDDRLKDLDRNAKIASDAIISVFENAALEGTYNEVYDVMESQGYMAALLFQLSSSIDADIFYINERGFPISCQCEVKTNLLPCNKHASNEYKGWINKNILGKLQTKNPEKIEKEGYAAIANLPATDGTESPGLYRVRKITMNGESYGIIVATTTLDQVVGPYIKEVIRIFLIAMAIALVVLYIFVYIFISRVTKPLSQMAGATKSYAEGDFSLRIPIERDDELGELINSFNTMASALSITETSRRSFVANVSHELKTPMTTIGGFIDGILDGTIPPEKRDYYLKIVHAEIKRLSRLVVSMLNLSKIEEGQVSLNLTEFNISKQLVDTLLTFEKSIEDKCIGITGLDNLDSVFLTADEDMINQVIYNLVENAVKFTPQNGRMDFRVEESLTDVSITIGNTGEGISSEQLPRVFERFYKVDASRSYDKKGAGLGLYLVKTLVELHGGKVEASSTEGEYTQFRFNIPKSIDMKNRGER